VAAYSLDQFRILMRTGKVWQTENSGRCLTWARDSLFALTDSEIEELHAYLIARSQRLRT
jgi:hypothetical protein